MKIPFKLQVKKNYDVLVSLVINTEEENLCLQKHFETLGYNKSYFELYKEFLRLEHNDEHFLGFIEWNKTKNPGTF